MLKIRKPDFFIVGAPKCGTTAMHHYLSRHPEIFMAPKELHFFGSDLRFRYPGCSEKEYLACFRVAVNKKRVGEASNRYLYSRQAAYEIKVFSPSTSIIIMLRNPVDMLYSQHSQELYNGNEEIEDFKDALDAEEDRKRGLHIPKSAFLIDAILYRETARYTGQVKRYFDLFGRENVQVIIFDDFKSDTHGVYRETLRFLGVEEIIQPTFEVVNPNKRFRSKLVRDYMMNPPTIVRRFVKSLVPRPLRQEIFKGIERCNSRHIRRPPMDPGLYRRLQAEFAPEVEQLSDLLGRDLTYWCR